MIKKPLFIIYFVIVCFLFFTAIFSYSHLNIREDIFLAALIGLYTAGIFCKRMTGVVWDNFPAFLLIFLLSQFFINHFHPESLHWWFASIPGWLTVMIGFVALLSLIPYQKIKLDNLLSQAPNETIHDLINKASPGIILVSISMFFIFLLNFKEISPQAKLAPDYSIYIIIAVGFVLFYPLNFMLKSISLNLKKSEIFLKTGPLVILIFLVGIGTAKIYLVYVHYHNALHSRSEEKLWHDLLEVNRIPRIKSIDTKALTELGKIDIEKGNDRQASILYETILADQAFDFEANLGIAEIAYQQKEWKRAHEAYRRAIYLKPEMRELCPRFIHSLVRDGKINEAMEFIKNLREK